MKIGELRDLIKDLDPEMEVLQMAERLHEFGAEIDKGEIKETVEVPGYHPSRKVFCLNMDKRADSYEIKS